MNTETLGSGNPRVVDAFNAALRRWRPAFLKPTEQNYDGTSLDARVGLGILILVAGLSVLWGFAVAVAEYNALFLCVSLLSCLFIARDFRVGVVLLILLMPISTSYIFPHGMLGIKGLNPLNLLLFATLGSYLLYASAGRAGARFLPRILLFCYIIPLVVAGLIGSQHVDDIPAGIFISGQIEFSDAAGYVRDMVVKPLFLVLFALLVGAAVTRNRTPEKYLAAVLVSIWVMGLMVIGFVLMSGASLSSLAGSTSRAFLSPLGLHANDLGRLYATAYALLIFTWGATKNPLHKLLLFVTMGLVSVALLLTFSRGAMFSFIVVNVLFLWSRRSLGTLAIAAILTAIVLALLPGAFYYRFLSGIGGNVDVLSAGRVSHIWLPLISELLSSPFYGNGLGSILWSKAMQNFSILEVTHPHNAYLQTVLDMGFVGLILFAAYYLHVWKGFRRLSRDASLGDTERGFFAGANAALISFLISGFTGSSLAPVPEQAFLWLAIGMMYGYLHTKPLPAPQPRPNPGSSRVTQRS